ncbi:hypothetical protein Hamer_G016398 [Homarus americanus]|uniref:Uncharacterized protein n=1 Tax=Homarus americanus TaxID=6706 RepID=A0A8J5N6E9_HOMAM|nr:hypothetical protein Hamer_G016398 [Homarus americanus]
MVPWWVRTLMATNTTKTENLHLVEIGG